MQIQRACSGIASASESRNEAITLVPFDRLHPTVIRDSFRHSVIQVRDGGRHVLWAHLP